MSNCEMVVGLHLYQPPRHAEHEQLSLISTDPLNQNWTEIIDKESYRPLMNSEAANKISFDAFGTLRQDLERIDEDVAVTIDQKLKTNGIADTFIHPILPDLSREDKEIVVGAGKEAIMNDVGISLPFIWVPETALDYETLEVLTDFGYKGVICAPEQIRRFDNYQADNKVVKIRLSNNRIINVIPFDRPVSSALAFRDKNNADQFCQDFIKPAFNDGQKTIISYTDGETFGHHWKGGEKFLDRLINVSLPEQKITPISINSLDLNNTTDGELYNRSAWSCPHGDLIRWRDHCGCAGDGRWKKDFYYAFEELNNQITELVKQELGDDYKKLITENFRAAFINKGNKKTPSVLMSLVSAKVSALTARTSCGTFFDNPNTSGKINILFGVQAIAHLKDLGMCFYRSEKIGRDFYQNVTKSLTENQQKQMFDKKMLEILGIK